MLLFMLITFSLFWVVIKNNVIYCVRTGQVDGGGLFFPHAVNQLFTGLYFMELCLSGLFFLVRNTKGNVACGAQGTIMAVVLILTVIYQTWLMNHLAPLFKYAPIRLELESKGLISDEEAHEPSEVAKFDSRDEEKTTIGPSSPAASNNTQNLEPPHGSEMSTLIRPPLSQRRSSHRSGDIHDQQQADAKAAESILARLNQPLDEARLAQLESKLAGPEAGGGGILMPRFKDIEAQMFDDPISKIIMQHNDEIADLDPDERDMLVSVAFMHPILRETMPCVWIPTDELGVSDDEVRRTRELMQGVVIDNRGAYFDRKLKVRVDRQPPDMSKFALIMPEL